MDYSKQLDNYKKQAVYSMTQGEMLMLLYDELIKDLNRAKIWLEQKKIENFDKDIQKALDIVRYLRKILDMKYPISRELSRLYNFCESHLSRVLASRRADLIEEIIPIIQDLRSAFKEADLISREKEHKTVS